MVTSDRHAKCDCHPEVLKTSIDASKDFSILSQELPLKSGGLVSSKEG